MWKLVNIFNLAKIKIQNKNWNIYLIDLSPMMAAVYRNGTAVGAGAGGGVDEGTKASTKDQDVMGVE